MSTLQSPLKRLWNYGPSKRRKALIATSFSVINKLFDLAPPVLIGMSIDVVVTGDGPFARYMPGESKWEKLLSIAIATFLVWAFESLFEYLLKVWWRTLAQEMQHDMRDAAYRHLQQLDMSFFDRAQSGQLMATVNDDVNQLERFLDDGANSIIQLLTSVSVIGVLFFSISAKVASLSFLPIPIIIWGSFIYQKKARKRYRDVRDSAGELNALLSHNLQGMMTIKSYNAQDFEAKRVHHSSSQYTQVNAKAIKLSSAFSPLIRFAVLLGFLGTLLYGGHLTISGELAVGLYSTMVFMTQRLLWPLTRLGATVDLYQRSMASVARIFDLMDTPILLRDGPKTLTRENAKQDLHFENISFSYDHDNPVLAGLSFTVPCGTTTAFVGGTGSGKSTLVKLLLRFYDPTEGEIKLGEESIQSFHIDDLRSQISYVGQDAYLFHGTVADNIRYGSFGISDEKVLKAAKLAHAESFINELPQGMATIVGERGQKLSGGQRQRLALARAILKDAPIWILDEATSAVDNYTEAMIQKSIKDLTKNKTTLIIAHRLSTITHADQIIVLDQGKLKEKGMHEQLIEKGGDYGELWTLGTR